MNKKPPTKEYPIKLAGQIWGGFLPLCSWCQEEVHGFKDKLSAQEFRISGFCQDCQNKTFKNE